ncbi:MFS transporter [Streptomyces meridianus]|uniref:MFS transporter n=1 Tax=Streptomyces meridianus TaxID=2938945 RepID=A0ABT0X0X3_9ACTN|nr:MFS transporter [Streptomyces meridianus]MCM2575795.1 MFS transporter [Streptomyces meridianus]
MTAAEPRDAVAEGPARSAAGGAGEHDGEPAGRTVVDPALLPTGPEQATAAETLEGVMSRPYRALSIGIISVVVLIAFEAMAVGTAMPVAARELHGVPLYAFAFSAFFTTSLFGMVAAGQWSDRSGPLASLAAGIAAFAAGLGLAGAAGSMWMFVAGRAVQGLGGGLVIVALYVVVGRAYPERLRPTIMAAFAASWVVPSVVGPVAAGSVTEQFGWRWVFLAIPVLVVPPLLIALPAIRRIASGPAAGPDEEKRGAGARNRIVLALAASVGAGLLQYAGQDLRPLSLLLGAAGAVLLVPSALRLLPKGTYRAARGLPSVILLRGVAAGSFVLAESFMPLMLVTERGMSVTMAGLSLAGGGATWAVGSYIQSRTAAQAHRERLVRFGMLLVAASIATAPAVLIPAVPVWCVAVAWCLGCLGMGAVISSTAVLLLKLSRPEEAGSNSAALQVSDSLAGIALLGVCGAAFAALGGGVPGGAVHGATGGVHIAPAAFLAVFVPAAVVALFGAFVATRLHARPGAG